MSWKRTELMDVCERLISANLVAGRTKIGQDFFLAPIPMVGTVRRTYTSDGYIFDIDKDAIPLSRWLFRNGRWLK